MQAITTIGLDIAKSVFQVHGVDAAGQDRRDQCDPRTPRRARDRRAGGAQQFLQFLTPVTPIFGFNFQNWMLIAAAIVVFWTTILFRGAK